MADFRLPELKPADVDYVNAFAKGYAAPDVMQAPGLANTLTQAKITEEQNKLAAGAEYAKTKDPNALAGGFPVETAKFNLLQQEQAGKSLKAAGEAGFLLKDALKDPATYRGARDYLMTISKHVGLYLPETFDPVKTPLMIDSLAGQYIKAKKLEGTRTSGMTMAEFARDYPTEYNAAMKARQGPQNQHAVIPFGGGDATLLPPGVVPHLQPNPQITVPISPTGQPGPPLPPGQRGVILPQPQTDPTKGERAEEAQTFKIEQDTAEKVKTFSDPKSTPESKAQAEAVLRSRGWTDGTINAPGAIFGTLWPGEKQTLVPPPPVARPTRAQPAAVQQVGPGRKPSQQDLGDYQRALQMNQGNPERIQAIKQKAVSAWGYAP